MSRDAHLCATSSLPSSALAPVSFFIRRAAARRWLRRVRAGVSRAGIASLGEGGSRFCLEAVLLAATSKMETGSIEVGGEKRVSCPADLKTFFFSIISTVEQEVWQ